MNLKCRPVDHRHRQLLTDWAPKPSLRWAAGYSKVETAMSSCTVPKASPRRNVLGTNAWVSSHRLPALAATDHGPSSRRAVSTHHPAVLAHGRGASSMTLEESPGPVRGTVDVNREGASRRPSRRAIRQKLIALLRKRAMMGPYQLHRAMTIRASTRPGSRTVLTGSRMAVNFDHEPCSKAQNDASYACRKRPKPASVAGILTEAQNKRR